jgi:hypothetical protein
MTYNQNKYHQIIPRLNLYFSSSFVTILICNGNKMKTRSWFDRHFMKGFLWYYTLSTYQNGRVLFANATFKITGLLLKSFGQIYFTISLRIDKIHWACWFALQSSLKGQCLVRNMMDFCIIPFHQRQDKPIFTTIFSTYFSQLLFTLNWPFYLRESF